MGMSRRWDLGTGSGCSRQTQSQGGPCQQPVSWASGSNRRESLGRDLLLWSCRLLSELWFCFLQPISQFPEAGDAVSVACLTQNKRSFPKALLRLSPWLRMGWIGQRAGCTSNGSGGPHPRGSLAQSQAASQAHKGLFSRPLSRHPFPAVFGLSAPPGCPVTSRLWTVLATVHT